MDKYVCEPCGYVYDPKEGDPDNGIEPGTAFEDLPEDWVCPLCGLGKEVFVKETAQGRQDFAGPVRLRKGKGSLPGCVSRGISPDWKQLWNKGYFNGLVGIPLVLIFSHSDKSIQQGQQQVFQFELSMKLDKDKNKFKADDTKPRRKGVGSFARMVKAEIKDINCKERWI